MNLVAESIVKLVWIGFFESTLREVLISGVFFVGRQNSVDLVVIGLDEVVILLFVVLGFHLETADIIQILWFGVLTGK